MAANVYQWAPVNRLTNSKDFLTLVQEISVTCPQLKTYVRSLLDMGKDCPSIEQILLPCMRLQEGFGLQVPVRELIELFYAHGIADGVAVTAPSMRKSNTPVFDRNDPLKQEIQALEDKGFVLGQWGFWRAAINRELYRQQENGKAGSLQLEGEQIWQGMREQVKYHILLRMQQQYAQGVLDARNKDAKNIPTREIHAKIKPLVTFFMLVTDRDCLIADYCIRSYQLLQGVKFKLLIYANWLNQQNKKEYFPQWRRLKYVQIIENNWQVEQKRPEKDNFYGVEGPYERYEGPLDRELKKITTPYYATVDADFEILDPQFVVAMVAMLEADPRIGVISCDQTHPQVYIEQQTARKKLHRERLDTWFCIYRQKTLDCNVSHRYYQEPMQDKSFFCQQWDSAGLFQRVLKDVDGWQMQVLGRNYQHCFIHYGAFSKNKFLDQTNIGLYRWLQICINNADPKLIGDKAYQDICRKLYVLLDQIKLEYNKNDPVQVLASQAYDRLFRKVDENNPFKDAAQNKLCLKD